ncbi:MAG: helix-turn-helix domain-containing protein, partial [Actinomycetota bacterium]
RDLVEEMLAGDRQLSSASRRVLSSLGFRPSAECRAVVAAVREDGGCGEADATRMAMEAIDKALACGGEAPLIVARHAEVLAVVLEHAFSTFLERLAQTASDLKRTRGISIAAGASLVCQGFEGMPVAHRQAQLALRQARNGQVLTLSEASLLSYLVSAADATGRAIVPLEVKELMAKDVRCRGALLETLLAYMDADLNVARVARTLFVHPNTVHYRLHRIEKITGRSTRSFRDLVELLIAIETLRSGSDSTAPEPGRTPRSPRSGPAG